MNTKDVDDFFLPDTTPEPPPDPEPAPVPFGYCHCGCGEKTKIAPRTRTKENVRKGYPMMFILNHHAKLQKRTVLTGCICGEADCTIPYGLCHCGCGKRTLIARVSNAARYRVKGEPYRYFHGHALCQSGPEYLIEDRGYNTPCWVWQRHINEGGYGMMRDELNGGKLRSAHKTYYERANGPVPNGLEIDHLCRVRCCVNPDHLEAVLHLVNMDRGISCTITTEQITDTKRLLAKGVLQIPTAKTIGISQSAVSDIKLGKKDHRLNDKP
jgi:hypothetical protein